MESIYLENITKANNKVLQGRIAKQNQISRLNGEVVSNWDQGAVKNSLNQIMKEGEGGQSGSEGN